MKERPILFQGEMVRALLAGTKTQTRRIGRIQNPEWTELGVDYIGHATKGVQAIATFRAYPGGGSARHGICACPYGVAGDRLWVKETHCYYNEANEIVVAYRADGWTECPAEDGKWKPSIYCTRAASRITLEITDVRAERLNAISEEDAIAEGVSASYSPYLLTVVDSTGNTCQITPDYIYGVPKPGEQWMGRTVAHVEPCPGALLYTAREAYRTLWTKINGPGSWDASPWVWVITFKRITP